MSLTKRLMTATGGIAAGAIVATLVFGTALQAETCHVPTLSGKVFFRDAVDALQCQYRKAGKQVTILAIGKNKPVMDIKVFEKYRNLPLYDFISSASKESPYEFSIEKMQNGGNDDFTIYAVSYKKIKIANPVEQMTGEARRSAERAAVTVNKGGNTTVASTDANATQAANANASADANTTQAANANASADANTTQAADAVVYTTEELINDLATIRQKIPSIREKNFDTDFIDWDINRIIESIRQYQREKQLSEG